MSQAVPRVAPKCQRVFVLSCSVVFSSGYSPRWFFDLHLAGQSLLCRSHSFVGGRARASSVAVRGCLRLGMGLAETRISDVFRYPLSLSLSGSFRSRGNDTKISSSALPNSRKSLFPSSFELPFFRLCCGKKISSSSRHRSRYRALTSFFPPFRHMGVGLCAVIGA